MKWSLIPDMSRDLRQRGEGVSDYPLVHALALAAEIASKCPDTIRAAKHQSGL